ncbi:MULTISPECIES: LysR family transcriptional regulator [unclassified Shewanella]|uniref:LysR family transcriptional regulator n=1 Tax=unclassified Shewanella TaxID=196818 RepID=UPI000C8509E1|nr:MULTISPECIES: LysR family transcriptional regulator [unclassified Shewanella]MDO6677471.1 LysR family transcriptional regulator [Shewanella sp. 4_MG-2023]PMG43488.1 LysR family transcriptional regulator [Shewanella sp. 10N.286.52.B9]
MLIQDLHIILKVAEFRSITAAANSLDMRMATASAAVKRVEAALGVELFVRTTRQLRLSPAGERYLPQCELAVQLLDNAQQNAQEDLDVLKGEIRIALSSDLGRNVVTPWLDDFLLLYPDVALRSNITDSNIDFYRDSVDMALRYGEPSDASMYGFRICSIPRVLCATPSYLDKNGAPTTPDELKNHNGLFYQLQDIVQNEWRFSHQNQSHKVKLKGNRASNDGDLVRRWCVSGHGFAIKSCLDMADDLLTGRVVNVMPEYKPTATELWLVCPSRQSITPTMRLLRDYFREKTQQLLSQLVAHGVLNKQDIK